MLDNQNIGIVEEKLSPSILDKIKLYHAFDSITVFKEPLVFPYRKMWNSKFVQNYHKKTTTRNFVPQECP